MGLIAAIRGWWNSMFNRNNIEDVFGVQIAVSPLMQSLQQTFKGVERGVAEWNLDRRKADGFFVKGVPSLKLASAISAEVAKKVAIGLESTVEGSPRADYINEQYQLFLKDLRDAVIMLCNSGEIILKPYEAMRNILVTVSDFECYWPIAYDLKADLIDVIFGAVLIRDKNLYRLLERHTFDSDNGTQEIVYRAFRTDRTGGNRAFTPNSIGNPIPLSQVPEWAHLTDIVISGLEKPLFAYIRMPNTETVETPQLQGLPLWSKAIDRFRKADLQEARTDWEFEGGELAINASNDLFMISGGKKGEGPPQVMLPQGKERLYRALDVSSTEFTMETFAPEFRIDGLNKRMNQIKRDIEFLCGISHGIISDVENQDKTAEEVRASKDRYFTTVSDIQSAMEDGLKHLVDSFNAIADIQGMPTGAYDTSFVWDDSIMADRPTEFDERLRAQGAGWLSQVENRAWWLGVDIDSEEAQNLPEMAASEF